VIDAVRALVAGLRMVLRAPGLLLFVSLVTIASALPFGIVLADRLRTALADQPPIPLEAVEIDAEWWLHFRAQARGLEATFTPAIVGFAAPLDNLSALVDATARPLVLVVPVTLYALVWAFLWGGVLHRFHQGGGASAREFLRAGLRQLPRFAVIAAVAAGASIALFVTVHVWLFGPVYSRLAANAATERDAFLWRVLLYVIFGSLLAVISLTADYARVSSVANVAHTFRQSLAAAVRFIRRNLSAVVTLYLLTGALFVALLLVYGVADRRFGGWRAVLLGQAFLIGRLAIRLTFAASEVSLFHRRLPSADYHSTSRGPEYAGPPAAT
jgi:hypothetical protein